jgi:hypothetical protein
MTSGRSAPKTLQVAAAVIGNALEWYDFIIFGFLTVVISRLFFPSDTQYASLLLTTATFGVGFFMRPVGGVLLGIYADRNFNVRPSRGGFKSERRYICASEETAEPTVKEKVHFPVKHWIDLLTAANMTLASAGRHAVSMWKEFSHVHRHSP